MEQENRQARTARAVRFGVYEVDLELGEVRKNGLKVRLQEQPFRVLALLVTHPGQLLTREELQERLWIADTLVDPDLGLNTAVKKIRTALGDSADNPRFVETLPKRGYRFIAPVQEIERNGTSVLQAVREALPRAARDEVEERASLSDGLEAGSPGSSSTRRKRYSYYWVPILVLVLAGVSILARQIAAKNLHISIGRADGNNGVSVYRAAYRPNQAAIGIGGYDLKSGGDQAFAFDYDHSGKLDHLVLYRPGTGIIWVVQNSGGTFSPVYAGNGIGGYDLKSAADRAFAFDYDHSGKLDHLVLYRPGTEIISILRNDGDGIFNPVYAHSASDPGVGIGGHDRELAADQAFAFDYDHSGKSDHLVLYRSDTGSLWILKNTGGTFAAVYAHSAPGGKIGADDPESPADRAFAFDYDHSGKLDHLVLYRPGTGTMEILQNAGGTFAPVYEGSGIGGYDLKSSADRAFAFDYDHSGKFDHLVLYRPGTGIISILKNSDGTFSPVYEGRGIGGYDLKSANDRAFAFDYDHSGKLDHFALYRPGTGIIYVSYLPRDDKNSKSVGILAPALGFADDVGRFSPGLPLPAVHIHCQCAYTSMA